jgi:hypothetical protein
MDSNKYFISGYAKLPQGITAAELYSVITVGLIVDKETSQIIDCDSSLVNSTAKDFLKGVVKGRYLNDIDKITDIFERQYLGHAKKAIISALRMCYDKYNNAIESE